jgi:hypothetical protein
VRRQKIGKLSTLPPWMWNFGKWNTWYSENSPATEVNCLNICQKKLNFIRKGCKIDVKAAGNQNFPAFIFHYPAETIFLSKLCYTTDVAVQIFVKLPCKWKPQNLETSRLWRSFHLFFCMKFHMPNIASCSWVLYMWLSSSKATFQETQKTVFRLILGTW